MIELGTLIDEFNIKISMGHYIWEEKLKLHLRPKPKYLSNKLWAKLVNLVLVQSVEKGELRDNEAI